MKPRSAKNKAVRLQNWIAGKLRNFFGFTVSHCKPAIMGETGVDIRLTEEAKEKFPFSVEAKARARVAIYEWWKQTVENTQEGTRPLLVIKADRREPLVIMNWETFECLLKK